MGLQHSALLITQISFFPGYLWIQSPRALRRILLAARAAEAQGVVGGEWGEGGFPKFCMLTVITRDRDKHSAAANGPVSDTRSEGARYSQEACRDLNVFTG